ncbi:MAG: hypothetical protein SFW08_14170 [Gemmatimonadaceae bacterium]|nr:hypothetical protein [Gemmatimonadaceae bacterium]
MRRFRAGWLSLAVVGTAAAAPIAAQETSAGLTAVECRGQTIDEIIVAPQGPLLRARLPEFIPNARAIEGFVRDAQSTIHRVTRPAAINPFLLLHVGAPCDERRRTESERVLRAQPYIADARITLYARGDGRTALVVETTDEVSVLLDAQLRAGSPHLTRLRLGNPNVDGRAVRAVVGFEAADGFRNGWNLELAKYAAFGTPVQFAGAVSRDPLGQAWQLELTRPFYSDFNRLAWTVDAGARDGYFAFTRRDTLPVSLQVDRRYVTAGGLLRVGPPGALFLTGATLTWERDRPSTTGVVIEPGTFTPAPLEPVTGRYVPTQSARINALLGWRRLRFLRVAGFDAVEGLQDVRRGIEVGGTIGRGLRALGSDDEDWFTTAGIVLGAGDEVRYGVFQAGAEARYAQALQRWDAIVASGRATGYWRIALNHTLVGEVDVAYGARNRTPFQLVLDTRDAGLRGFRGSREAGGGRAVLRVEERWYAGRVRNVASLAVAPFLDIGRLWAGDVPYGRDTPWGTSLGVALLGAVPPQSQVTWRLEAAARLTPDPWARRWQLRVVIRDVGRQFWREPRDVARSRPVTAPTSLFTWP